MDNNDRITNVDGIHVKHITVPNIFDNVVDGRNKFKIVVEYTTPISVPNEWTVEITPGFYDATRLAAELNTKIKDVSLSILEALQNDLDPSGLLSGTELYPYFFTKTAIATYYEQTRVLINANSGVMTIHFYDFENIQSWKLMPVSRTRLYDVGSHVLGYTGTETVREGPGGNLILGDADIITASNGIYDEGVDVTITDIRVASLTAKNPINLAGVTEIIIASPDLAQSNAIAVKSEGEGKGHQDILDIISLANTPRGQYAYHSPNYIEHTWIGYNSNPSTSDVRIIIQDIQGNPVKLPDNYHVTVCLGVRHKH